jgi:hypothetical protein
VASVSERSDPDWEARVRLLASAVRYPPTPDIAGEVSRRLRAGPPPSRARPGRLAAAVALVALLALTLAAVPPVRAALLEALRIGAVRILPADPGPQLRAPTRPGAIPTPTGAPLGLPTAASPATAPPTSATPSGSRPAILDLAGRTTLADARERAGFPIRLPSYPPDLGPPDHVHLQNLGGPVVVLVWMDPTAPREPLLSLHYLSAGTYAQKSAVEVVRRTRVNGRPAAWTEGPHVLEYLVGGVVAPDERRLVDGHTLVWENGERTHRLESRLSLREAVRVAESLR